MHVFGKTAGNLVDIPGSGNVKIYDTPLIGFADANDKLFEQYKELSEDEHDVIFGGRLGEYKYYDMDQVIAVALEKAKDLLL